ncbi:hypothetical protein MTX26_12720 [Bradyrhizobium sp. ISRA443]|uniref:hypothetical protein n=1 Tax=unclassified Bradyrhizobium TaxID=2631580 RepID=UPI0024785B10|nr:MULTISPECIES: hypothetical protein [unclassified Bradyrhizobium]WGS01622.1 hypothetical protein MTX23_12730 [Bradyrhizobium sp. ISRA436]WGS08508.1 hypothetical protein MTX18_12720 [Bradyrhizobium sp. ISRA437]WGS15396.1 hypothetical protein MTX26_12720 [Bradyrhizobium sp. ISRA443]
MDKAISDGTNVGTWHLEIVRNGWSDQRVLMDPLPGFPMNDRTAEHPETYSGSVVAADKKLSFDNADSSFICSPGPENNPCAFVDFVHLTQIDDHHVRYDAKNHGGRVFITLKIFQQQALKLVDKSDEKNWVMGASFLVFVPSDALDATVVGKMGANDIFFTPSKPLTGDDAVRFKLIDSKDIAGVGSYYTFRVVNPFPS